MVFKIICVGSIPAILVIKLVITKSRKKVQLTSRYYRRRRRASILRLNIVKTRARLLAPQSNFNHTKSSRHLAKLASNHRILGLGSNIASKYNTSKLWTIGKSRPNITSYRSLTSIYLLANSTNINIKVLETLENHICKPANSYKLASSMIDSNSFRHLPNFNESLPFPKSILKSSSSSKFHRHLVTRA